MWDKSEIRWDEIQSDEADWSVQAIACHDTKHSSIQQEDVQSTMPSRDEAIGKAVLALQRPMDKALGTALYHPISYHIQ